MKWIMDLFRKPEPEIRYLPNPSEWVNYYRVEWNERRASKGGTLFHRREKYFRSCAQALEEHPDLSVSVVVGAEIDGRTFIAPGNWESIEVQPKPKRAKGKA